jgi:hypothetical protein
VGRAGSPRAMKSSTTTRTPRLMTMLSDDVTRCTLAGLTYKRLIEHALRWDGRTGHPHAGNPL